MLENLYKYDGDFSFLILQDVFLLVLGVVVFFYTMKFFWREFEGNDKEDFLVRGFISFGIFFLIPFHAATRLCMRGLVLLSIHDGEILSLSGVVDDFSAYRVAHYIYIDDDKYGFVDREPCYDLTKEKYESMFVRIEFVAYNDLYCIVEIWREGNANALD